MYEIIGLHVNVGLLFHMIPLCIFIVHINRVLLH